MSRTFGADLRTMNWVIGSSCSGALLLTAALERCAIEVHTKALTLFSEGGPTFRASSEVRTSVSYPSSRNHSNLFCLQTFSKDCTNCYPFFENGGRTSCEAEEIVTSGISTRRLFGLNLGRPLYYAGRIIQYGSWMELGAGL